MKEPSENEKAVEILNDENNPRISGEDYLN